jgi:enoyl-CoA hydratase
MTCVTLRQLTEGLRLTSFAEAMALEYRIARRAVPGHDFSEGVRALILDRDNNPRWSPATLGEVTDAMVDAFFARLPQGEEWTPLTDKGDTP